MGLSSHEFWGLAPKTFFCMMDEWELLEQRRAMYFALANNGQPLPEVKRRHDVVKEAPIVHPFFF